LYFKKIAKESFTLRKTTFSHAGEGWVARFKEHKTTPPSREGMSTRWGKSRVPNHIMKRMLENHIRRAECPAL